MSIINNSGENEWQGLKSVLYITENKSSSVCLNFLSVLFNIFIPKFKICMNIIDRNMAIVLDVSQSVRAAEVLKSIQNESQN